MTVVLDLGLNLLSAGCNSHRLTKLQAKVLAILADAYPDPISIFNLGAVIRGEGISKSQSPDIVADTALRYIKNISETLLERSRAEWRLRVPVEIKGA